MIPVCHSLNTDQAKYFMQYVQAHLDGSDASDVEENVISVSVSRELKLVEGVLLFIDREEYNYTK